MLSFLHIITKHLKFIMVSLIFLQTLALAIEASKTSADIILMAGVHFIAETAKLMSPEKKLLLTWMQVVLCLHL